VTALRAPRQIVCRGIPKTAFCRGSQPVTLVLVLVLVNVLYCTLTNTIFIVMCITACHTATPAKPARHRQEIPHTLDFNTAYRNTSFLIYSCPRGGGWGGCGGGGGGSPLLSRSLASPFLSLSLSLSLSFSLATVSCAQHRRPPPRSPP